MCDIHDFPIRRFSFLSRVIIAIDSRFAKDFQLRSGCAVARHGVFLMYFRYSPSSGTLAQKDHGFDALVK
jgi:hypothetical protein